MPEAVLAAIVIHAVAHTLTLAAFKPYFAWKRDRVAIVAAALAVILFGVLYGLLAGIAISLAMTLRGLSEPRVSELGRLGEGHDFLSFSAHMEVGRVTGLLLLRPEAPLFFANVEGMLTEIRKRIATVSPRALVVSLEESPDLDGTSIEALDEFAAELARSKVKLVFARLKEPVLALLNKTLPADGPTELVRGSVDDAVTLLCSPTVVGEQKSS